MGDIIVMSVLAGFVLLAVRSLLKSRARGGCCGCSGCSGGCAGCPHSRAK
ncbi:MAG: FeoB-associated Cys-rich membrane protein [Oscillospiraceae bacterium]|nr:FeoB-associated Cys-rich membrane protein [Oscillospiraceae bacterium]